jgi:osmotically-inducible protein OsmY
MTDTEPPEYLAERLHDAIATRSEVHELGIVVQVTGGTVVLSGSASSAAQRDAIGALVGELAPDHEVVNDVDVPSTEPPRRVEQL